MIVFQNNYPERYVTLPLAADYEWGKELTIRNYRSLGENLTIKCQSGDTFMLAGDPTSIILPYDAAITLECDGVTQWIPKHTLGAGAQTTDGTIIGGGGSGSGLEEVPVPIP